MSRTGCPRVLWPANSTERDICFIRDFHKIIRLGYRHKIIITRTMQLIHIIKVLLLNTYVRTLYSFPFLHFNLFTTVIKIPSTITSKNLPTQQQFSLFYNLVSTVARIISKLVLIVPCDYNPLELLRSANLMISPI